MTERDRRAVLRGAALVVGAVLVLRILPGTVRRLAGGYAALRAQAELLARAEDELRHAGSLPDSAARLSRALVTLAPALLAGDGDADAFADLSGLVTLAALQSRATLERVELVPDSGLAGRLRRVQGRAALEGDVQGLARFLEALEGGAARLAVQDLLVQAPAPFGPERGPEALRWEVTVSGWYLATR